MSRIAALSVLGMLICGSASSVAQSEPRIAFEVASVRMISGDAGLSQFSQTLTDTRVDITGPLSWAITTSFRSTRQAG